MTAFASIALAAPSAAFAADSYPPSGETAPGSAQPVIAGYRVQDIRDWSPDSDPFAPLLRATVPLQERNARNPDTQVKPELDGKAQIMLMQGDYGNSFFGSTTHNNTFTDHTLNFWQYVDYWSPWHGAASHGVPQAIYDPSTSNWRDRGFEFGVLSIPTPEYTNAAHRNGVKSIAGLYFDPYFRPGLTFQEMFDKNPEGDGYLLAQKLVEMARYYGFDGFFLNQEENANPEEFKPFMAYLTGQGLYTQWYDTNSSFNEAKAQWLRDDANGRIHNSVFVNYGNDGRRMNEWATANGYDPYAEVFAGIEANQTGFGGTGGVDRGYASDDDHSPRTSVALFTPSDYYQRGLDDQIGELADRKSPELPFMQQQPYQWMIADRERMYFSGMLSDVSRTGAANAQPRPDVGVTSAGWVGVADFAPARSVVRGRAFSSDFSTGRGMRSYTDGAVSGTAQWSDMGAQSILPSWQWWITSEGARTLEADFDYGEEPRENLDGTPASTPFAPHGAWEGGNSLVLHGSAAAPQTIRLFKTDLEVVPGSQASVTWRQDLGNAQVSLALVFADDPAHVHKTPLGRASGEWTTSVVDLGANDGRRISTIGLVVEDSADSLQVNIGKIAISDGAHNTPSAPTGLRVDELTSEGELIASWDADDFADVDYYILEAVDSDGRTRRLAKTFAGSRYVKNVGDDSDFTLRLRAIGKDGSSSLPCDLPVRRSLMPSALRIETANDANGNFVQAAKPDEVTLKWQAPRSVTPAGYRVRIETLFAGSADPYRGYAEVVVGPEAAEATVPAPPEGLPFKAGVEALGAENDGGAMLSVRGRYHDHYARPLEARDLESGEGGLFRLHNPTSSDWHRITSTGDEEWTATRGKNNHSAWGNDDENGRLTELRALASSISYEVEDYAGNTSGRTTLVLEGGSISLEDGAAPEVWASPWNPQTLASGRDIVPITVSARDNATTPKVSLSLVDPTTNEEESDLLGLAFDAGTGTISGRPAWTGTRLLRLSATDDAENVRSMTIAVTAGGPPAPQPPPKDPDSPAPAPPEGDGHDPQPENRPPSAEGGDRLALTGPTALGAVAVIASALLAAGLLARRRRH